MKIWITIPVQKKNRSVIEALPISKDVGSGAGEEQNISALSSQDAWSSDFPDQFLPEKTQNSAEIDKEAGYFDTVEKESFSHPVSAEDLKERWTGFLELLLKDHANLCSFLSVASVIPVSSGIVELKFSGEYRFQYTEVTKRQNRSAIIRLLEQFAGRPVELQITFDVNAPKQEESNYIKKIGNIASTIDDHIEKEPVIQAVMEIFDAEILD